MRELLSLDATRRTPLLKGPYISLSKSFRQGAAVADLVSEGVLHPFLANLIAHEHVYGHQERAIRAVRQGRTTLVSTGTGSGKTECFLYPIISRCLELRDEGAPAGITAVLIYPMNALAEDQLGRLRGLLAGTGITFGMYVGSTPERSGDVSGERLPEGASQADYQAAYKRAKAERRGTAVHPAEERCAREEMRTPGEQPRILVTNVKQLELLLTRHADAELFDGARLEFLVTDEAHTFTGAAGAETACLLRRLRAFCGKSAEETTCIATSATIADPETGVEAGRDFASRFFGVDRDQVALVGEEYAPETWDAQRQMPPPLSGDPAAHLRAVLEAVDSEDDARTKVPAAYQAMTGERFPEADWEDALFDRLARNEVVYQIAQVLDRAKALPVLLEVLASRLGREVPEEEVLAWLALGAAARKEGRPLLRPVVHAFVRGVGGAVVTFPVDRDGPRLWLSAEDERREEDAPARVRLPVLACTTCGQHYFTHHLEDLDLTQGELGGGRDVGGRTYWPAQDEALGGQRAVLVDRVMGSDDEDEDLGRLREAHLCRSCGALHPAAQPRCDGCGTNEPLVRLYVVEQKAEYPGMLSRCVSCGSPGRNFGSRYREPARPVRAVTVADVHVLAQDMVHHADRRRLLVFADNRQDAAFQAGWMRDHARRFRLRALMNERIRPGPVGIGDLVAHLNDRLEADDELSRALIPEVWSVYRKEQESTKHDEERRRFLRIQVLRELTVGVKQPTGLEPWGRLRVEYAGLSASAPFIVDAAAELGVPAEDLAEGIGAFLDLMRRRNLVLYDREGEIFTKFWGEGELEIQRGYLPQITDIPKGVKLRRKPSDDPNRVYQLSSQTGHLTNARQIVQSWGVRKDDADAFLESLWKFLTDDLKIFVPVTLRGQHGRALPRTSGVYQIDADKVRRTPHNRCLGWHCDGTLEYVVENKDSYDLALLDLDFAMIRPQEHSAQVAPEERDRVERLFKGSGEAINALVCTPMLELGVDIGELDTVLLRNVPPLPSNYWQRVGRAGRRHRMAVNVTYARPLSHDQVYFADPAKMLDGRVEPPRFNLRNDLMVRKHVHAALLTRLHQLRRDDSGLSEFDRQEIASALEETFPAQIRSYLFDDQGAVRARAFRADAFRKIVSRHEGALAQSVTGTFRDSWPAGDRAAVDADVLRSYVNEAPDRLEEMVTLLHRRLHWALDQMQRLERVRQQIGTLEPADAALYERCNRLVRRLKGQERRQRREAEGYDDINTFAALAAEGYLPGYGLETGSVMAVAQLPRYLAAGRDFVLRRPAAMAVREYVPGNLLYANGQRFIPRYFHLGLDSPGYFHVDPAYGAVAETGPGRAPQPGNYAETAGVGATTLRAVPICDVDMPHFSHISDEEEFRFQMPVSVYGYEKNRWNAGTAYRWGDRTLQHRTGVHFRLVNVGATRLVSRDQSQVGYPVCLVCGQSASPYSSARQLEHFTTQHEERCGQRVEATGFYADAVADALSLPDCEDREEAYSVLEALRTGAAQVLDMQTEDLEILVIGQAGSDRVQGVLYDPMPGGSGLLDQISERFDEVVQAARNLVENCPSDCTRACVDCLLRFRNAFFHVHLNRNTAADRFHSWGDYLEATHEIPPNLPRPEPTRAELPVNAAEQTLRAMILKAALPEPQWHKQINLGRPLGTTTPDCYYPGEEPDEPGICVYLDGLSEHIHGNPETQQQDRKIREQLRAQGYDVIEIAASDLYDCDAMARHFAKLARLIDGRERARKVKGSVEEWFVSPAEGARAQGDEGVPAVGTSEFPAVVPFRVVEGAPAEQYKTTVPLMSLKAAAGAFGESMEVNPEAWVEPNTQRKPEPGMFVAQVVGKSMEPEIPDGAYCLFRPPAGGSRTGRTVLAQHRSIHDPDLGGSYTVKKFDSTGVAGKDAQERTGTIYLKPVNPDYEPIKLKDVAEEEVQVVAELVEVLGIGDANT